MYPKKVFFLIAKYQRLQLILSLILYKQSITLFCFLFFTARSFLIFIKILKLSQKAKSFLHQQRRIYRFFKNEYEKVESNTIETPKDFFVPQILTTTDIAKIVADKAGLNQTYSFQFDLSYDQLTCDQQRCEQISRIVGKNFRLSNSSYEQFIYILKDKIDWLEQIDLFMQDQETESDNYEETQEETKLAINLVQDPLTVEDINKLDDDNLWTCIKKIWPILLCIAFCGAALGICLVNAPLHIQGNLEGTGMMVTLYQASFNFAQIFGSPFCHWLSEKIGYKPVYTIIYACYTITMFLGSLATENTLGSKGGALAFLYCMRIIQGFAGISQPLGFSMLSTLISPRYRSYSSAMNNVAFFVGGLLGTIINAFIAPAAGWFPSNDEETTYINSMYICGVLCALSFIFSLFVKESNPQTLIKKACKKNGIKYHPPRQQHCTWKEAFRLVFTRANLILLFVGLILGLGNCVSNLNVATLTVRTTMLVYNTTEAQKFISWANAIGIAICTIYAVTLFQKVQRWLGLPTTIALSCWSASLTSILRGGSPQPINQTQFVFSVIFNQFGQVLIDAPFIAIVSTYTNTYNKARIMGVYQLSNSLSRSILVFLAGVLFDWHKRNAQFCYTFFAMAAATVAAFIKQPTNIKLA